METTDIIFCVVAVATIVGSIILIIWDNRQAENDRNDRAAASISMMGMGLNDPTLTEISYGVGSAKPSKEEPECKS